MNFHDTASNGQVVQQSFKESTNSGEPVLCFTVELNQTLWWESQKKICQTESISQSEDIIRTAFTKSILFRLIAT